MATPPNPQDDYGKMMKGKTGLQRIINATAYSRDGLRAACEEQGFRQLLWLHGILLVLSFVLPFSLAVQMVLVLVSGLSLAVELLNTGIEAAVDHTSLERHPLAKRAKDVGSAAQSVMLALTALLWVVALVRSFI